MIPTPTVESSYTAWTTHNRETIAEMKHLEEENNRLFIDAYGLADELTPDVPIEQITLTVNPAYRYGGKLTEEAQWTRFRHDTMTELVSYAIGCMMGRYSLDVDRASSTPTAATWVSTQAATPRSLPTQTASSRSPTPIGLTMMPPIASSSSSRWPGMQGSPRRQPRFPGRQPLAQEERVQPRDAAPLPLRQLLQGPSADLQEAPHLLAVLER